MNYYQYRLKFDTPVHFGPSDSSLSLYSSDDHFCADTLFSGLCHTALSLYGGEKLKELCEMAGSGKLRLSDSMPFKNERCYLPKPCVSGEFKGGKTNLEASVLTSEKKLFKKMAWIPVINLSWYMRSMHGESNYVVGDLDLSFGEHSTTAKVQIRPGEDALPYSIGLYSFKPHSGLWFLAGTETSEQNDFIRALLKGLGLSGIGGKTSSGYGKFHIVDEVDLSEPFDDETYFLSDALSAGSGYRQLLLTTSLPSDGDLERVLPDSEYRLVRRGGFVSSDNYADTPRKKRAQYFLAAGSVLPERFEPRLYDVGEADRHPVYRFSGPIFLGINEEAVFG